MPFLSIQNNTSVTDELLFTIQHEKYTHSRGKSSKTPAVLKQKIHVKWIISTQTHISLFKTEACVLSRLDGWVNCSRLNRYSIYTNTHTRDLWTLKDKQTVLLSLHWCRSLRPQMCVCCKRDTTWRPVSDLSWHRCLFFSIFILLTPL